MDPVARERSAAQAALAQGEWSTARTRFARIPDPGVSDLDGLAVACWWLGLVDEFIDASERLHDAHAADGAPARAGRAAVEIAYMEILRGNEGTGMGWFARARRLLEADRNAPERGYLLVLDGAGAVEAREWEAADALSAELLELASTHGDPTLQALGLFGSGESAVHQGKVTDGLRALDEAMLLVLDGRVAPSWAGNLYCRMMQMCSDLGDLPRARYWTDITERWQAGYAPAVIFRGICRVHRVELLQVEGQWDRAAREAATAAEELDGIDLQVAAEAHYRLGEIHRLRGELDAAEASYRRAHRAGRDPLPGLALVHLDRGRCHVAASVLDAALATAATAAERAPLLAARTEVALATAEAVDTETAESAVTELEQLARDHHSPAWRADAHRWRGTAHLAAGRTAEAVTELREARHEWQRMGAPYLVARIRLDLARALARLGDSDSADRERQAAAESLSRLGARRDLARVGSPGAGEDRVLSAREVEVLAAIADGSTNRDASGRLHISERTVARHLANVYRKVGAASRTGAVAWARERGLL
ncbi:LuxR C-terminal-related transcriptional regulator [Glycomyces xiaoerkulensis]|uniref:LuxR C-terminal-related transcriptional regulator n=1 Tax=Glycomyces xiaoerkulensis TaxID=2038139 RepID=UPI000C266654|nr:LuxR C-terminal-related transcriptional regulator [Glycomyces xiaoerkulensis]